MTTPTAPVTITHVPMTRTVYDTLLRAIDTEQEEYGKHSELESAKKWLHYRWLLEQGKPHGTQSPTP